MKKSPNTDKVLFSIVSKSRGEEQYFSLRRLQVPMNEKDTICVLPYEAIAITDLITNKHILWAELNSKSKGELLMMSRNTRGFEILNVIISSICSHRAILLGKLGVSSRWRNFPAFYIIQNFNALFTALHHCSLSWARSIQSTSSHSVASRSIFIFSWTPCLGVRSDLFRLCFHTNTPFAFLFSSMRATCLAILVIFFGCSINIFLYLLLLYHQSYYRLYKYT